MSSTRQVRKLLELAASHDQEAVGRLIELMRAAPPDLEPYLTWALVADVHLPVEVYRAAGPTAQHHIVRRIETVASWQSRSRLLCVLAQTRGPVTEAAFRRWRDDPPEWAQELYLSPASYTLEGGWAIEGDGARELCGAAAYEMAIVGPAPPAKGRCPWCGSRLWHVMDVDTADVRVAEALKHADWNGRLRVATCHFCSCYAVTFSDVTPEGGTRWSDHNARPKYIGDDPLPEEPPDRRLVVGNQCPSQFPARDAYSGRSKLGGAPAWEQSAEYPACPSCGRFMAYVGQVDGSDLHEYGEGLHYVFLDPDCRIAAVVYQQT